jgi:L-rhamnose mutarotase
MEEYIRRENTYWKEVAKKAIAEDKLSAWSIWQRVGGFNVDTDHNILVVNNYTPEQFAMEGNIWDYKKVFPKAKGEDVVTGGMSITQDVLFYTSRAFYAVGQAKAIKVNFAKAKNPREYSRMEPEIWGAVYRCTNEIGQHQRRQLGIFIANHSTRQKHFP